MTTLPPTFTLRTAEVSDAGTVGALIEGVIQDLGFDLADEGALSDWPAVLGEFSNSASDGFWVLETADRIVGTVTLKRVDPQTAELGRLYLDPAYLGQGLGRYLAEVAIHEARIQGFSRVILETHTSLTPGNTLYRKLGFREIAPYSGHPLRYTDIAYALPLT